MKEKIEIRCGEDTEIHIQGSPVGVHATVCGLDGDDVNPYVDQEITNTNPSGKVNCPQCIALYDFFKSLKLKKTDFEGR